MKRLRLNPSAATRNSTLPTWGQIKQLTATAQDVVARSGKEPTVEALFLALLALLSLQVTFVSGSYLTEKEEEKSYWT